MSKPIYVVGHRNPDTDSICSAIAYAYLKNAMGETAVPVRAGKLNAETKYVLEYFNMEIPSFLDDLYPRVKDVMTENPICVPSGSNLRELGHIMKDHHMKSVPVVGSDAVLLGMVSVGDLARRYFDELEIQDLCNSGVDFRAILKVLEGTLITGDGLDRKVTGKVKIAAMKSETLREKLSTKNVVITGNRVQAQLAAIEKSVDCLIITGESDLSSEVIGEAKKKNVMIIRTPYDTYTCARLINQSIPVDAIMHKEIVAFRPTDLISDIKNKIINSNHRNYPVVENGKLIGLINRDKLIVQEREKIILVDHNERTQAVEGIEEAQIIEIIDHHRLGGLQTGEPIFIRHEPVGSTATIVANMFWHRDVEIPSKIAGLLLAAIASDTILFKSPTATDKDRSTAEKLAAIAGLEVEKFGMEVLKSGAKLENVSASEVIHNDLKEFVMGKFRIAIGQIAALDPNEIIVIKEELLQYMNQLNKKESYDMMVLMITDIINNGTYLIYTTKAQELINKAFGSSGKENLVFLSGVMSRKKQVIPPLVEASRR